MPSSSIRTESAISTETKTLMINLRVKHLLFTILPIIYHRDGRQTVSGTKSVYLKNPGYNKI